MSNIAKGSFSVTTKPQGEGSAAEGVSLGRMALDKRFDGDLVGTGHGEMLTALTPVQGSAGYVAIERVTGTLHGRAGSFVLQHTGTMHAGAQQLSITVVPGSGTGGLAGLAGTFRLRIEGGAHFYELEYSLSGAAQAPAAELRLTPESVVDFLNRFELLAEKEDFDAIQPLIHEQAVFRFSDGDFIGRPAIRAVFERTWKGSANVKKDRFYLSDIRVLSVDRATATATYTWHWEGRNDGQPFRIQGRGTRVLVVQDGRVQIVHEHLSRFPRP